MNSPLSLVLNGRAGEARASLGAFIAVTVWLTFAHAATPPALLDAKHISNGCLISATAYVARLANELPEAKTEIVQVKQLDGSGHSVVVVSMNGKSYVRDWLVGVREISGENVQSAYTSAARAWLRLSGSAEKVREMNESIPATPTERSKEVAIAQEILGTGEVFTVGSYTVLVWRPTPKTMAAYEPSVGTMVAEVDMHSERFARSALLTRGLIASR